MEPIVKEKRAHIGIVICTFEPNLKLLENLILSLKNQSLNSWHCYIFDDSSSGIDFQHLLDDRFSYYKNHSTLGTYKNFEQGIRYAAPNHELIFLSDQDDSWDVSKLQKYKNHFETGKFEVLHGDARIVTSSGKVIADSLHAYECRKLSSDPIDLIVKNTVTGTTMAMKSSYIMSLKEFPKTQGWEHDLWLSLEAAARGTLGYIDLSLTNYIQHSNNQIGAMPRVSFHKNLSPSVAMGAFILKYKLLCNFINEIETLSRRKTSKVILQFRLIRHMLCKGMDNRYLAQYLFGGLIVLLFPIKQKCQKLSIRLKFRVDQIRRLVNIIRSKELYAKLNDFSANISKNTLSAKSYLNYSVTILSKLPPKFVLIVPNLKMPIFGGIATALRFASELQSLGNRVQIVTISEKSNIDQVDFLLTAKELGIEVEIAQSLFNGISNLRIEISEGDVLIATAWWTELAARIAINESDYQKCKILYFVQDFECLFYPASSEYALALETYTDADNLIVNSAPLAKFLTQNISDLRENDLMSFSPTYLFSDVEGMGSRSKQTPLGPIRILFYGRPNTPRNLFEMGVKALEILVERNPHKSFDIYSIGEKHPDIELKGGIRIKSLGALKPEDYRVQIEISDIGLSLMLSPHPSYPPLEMAAMGLPTVSNDYLGYKKDYLRSFGILVSEPTAASICETIQNFIETKESKLLSQHARQETSLREIAIITSAKLNG
jgi:glycosyltransferase involved in cell wall biosynthesis